ncbi:Phosphomannomutase [hydrothermal vent metagenome]|uniref:Phosphomannomutase n=1 Tax=hydrothermal vent metagenome TaxID=652676 RepID=A0A3B1APH5_9ZZZZ
MPEQNKPIDIAELMQQSGVGFGTSGARGLVMDMTDRVCYAYTLAFLQYLIAQGNLTVGQQVAIAGDFRSSTPRIMGATAKAIQDLGCKPINCGLIPTPALTLYGITHNIPSLMVTGSHIPDDRNGIKFNKPSGEILKQDEAAIRSQTVTIPAGYFCADGMAQEALPLPAEDPTAYHNFIQRYLDFFPPKALQGRRIGLYEHSSVARQMLGEILEKLGAEVTRLNRSQAFIPVDTEAIRPEDIELAREWALTYKFDCIISTDGDGDRPLISDEHGNWLRGDLLGILCAHYLRAGWVVTPVSSNSALEKSGWFAGVKRTRIGSPYVIAAMNSALAQGIPNVVGYEANGGFLTATDITQQGRILPALPTRDAVIGPLAVLMLAAESAITISNLVAKLPQRFTSSDRIKNFPTKLSQSHIATLNSDDFKHDKAAIEAIFAVHFGLVKALDNTDGLRITFANKEVVHLRASGNAPELRCYNEADTPQRAAEMNRICIKILEGWRTA